MKKRWLGVVALMAAGAAQAAWEVNDASNPTTLSDGNWTFTVAKNNQTGVEGLLINKTTGGKGVCDLTAVESDCEWKVVALSGEAFSADADVKTNITAFIGPDVTWACTGDQNGAKTFQGCANITRFKFSDGLWRLGRYVFDGCSSATEFEPRRMENMTELYRGCLKGLSNLEGGFDFPNVTTMLGDNGENFSGDAKLEYVYLPKLEVIDKGSVFNNCAALTSVDLSSVTKIAASSIFAESGLTNLELPELKTVTGAAFVNAKKLERLYIPKIEEFKVAGGDNSIFRYAGALKKIEPTTLPYLHNIDNNRMLSRDGTSIPIEGDFYCPALTNISTGAFAGTKITSFVAPKLITARSAFSRCTSLTNVVLGADVTTLAYDSANVSSYGCFEGCTALTNCVLGDLRNLSVLGKRAFYNCNQMTNEIVLASPAIRDIFDETFYNCQKVPSFTIASPVTNVGSKAFMNLGGGVSVTFTKDVEAAPTLWGATTPITSVANPFPSICVGKNLASWEALTGFKSIKDPSVAKYLTETYGYTGKKNQVGLFNEKAWVVDASAPAGSVLMLL